MMYTALFVMFLKEVPSYSTRIPGIRLTKRGVEGIFQKCMHWNSSKYNINAFEPISL